MFYDPDNNRQRSDKGDGSKDEYCGTVMPGIQTPCQVITAEDKTWVIHPSKSQCCFCCDSSQGCRIFRPDGLKYANYDGQKTYKNTLYDKWKMTGIPYNIQVTMDILTSTSQLMTKKFPEEWTRTATTSATPHYSNDRRVPSLTVFSKFQVTATKQNQLCALSSPIVERGEICTI